MISLLRATGSTDYAAIMADSDDEYISDVSDTDMPAPSAPGVRAHATRSTGPVPSAQPGRGLDRGGGHKRAAWEDIQRSWDTVIEGEDGTLGSTVEELKEANKRQR